MNVFQYFFTKHGEMPAVTVRPTQPLRVSRRRVVYDSVRAGAAVPEPIPEESEDLSCLEANTHDVQPLPDPVSIDSIASQLPPPTFTSSHHDDDHFSLTQPPTHLLRSGRFGFMMSAMRS